jgi:hypothetical protein
MGRISTLNHTARSASVASFCSGPEAAQVFWKRSAMRWGLTLAASLLPTSCGSYLQGPASAIARYPEISQAAILFRRAMPLS